MVDDVDVVLVVDVVEVVDVVLVLVVVDICVIKSKSQSSGLLVVVVVVLDVLVVVLVEDVVEVVDVVLVVDTCKIKSKSQIGESHSIPVSTITIPGTGTINSTSVQAQTVSVFPGATVTEPL